jgi:hypothetical protein
MKYGLAIIITLSALLQVRAQINFDRYHSGYYTDKAGHKITGLIRYWNGENSEIEFKSDKKAKKQKILPADCSEFVLDSTMRFIKVSGFTIKAGIEEIDVYDRFIEVLEEGTVGLYRYYSMGIDAPINGVVTGGHIAVGTLIIKIDGEYIGLLWNVKKRKKMLEELGNKNMDAELLEILCRKDEGEMLDLMKAYNLKKAK